MRLQPGDHIRAKRHGYFHHGIYDGDRVVHFSHPPNHFWGARTIRHDPLEVFNDGRPAEVVKNDDNLPRAEVQRRALAWLKQERGAFSLGANNCEHFANECANGKRFSRQVIRGQIVFMIVSVLVLLVGVGLVGRGA